MQPIAVVGLRLPFDSVLLLLAAIVLSIGQILSLTWGFRLMGELSTPEPGGQLLRILVTVATFVAMAQLICLISFLLLIADRYGSVDTRVMLFLISETIASVTIIWSMWRVRHLGR